ncbi:Las1-domain-containing protein [Meira miltonrushii]|uniref:Las1-domain-containing protein n=1 Tax=Meira miltonrushii TaxID=1280837 RepID=A0A316VI79_9BASI|nr:Las1-domain-containing protein [Meira miltonrushii]PWN37367.1 Las1-domain-containing protein [Meira miltonrushii]
MQLPRRTANVHRHELEELFALLYPSGAHAIAIDDGYHKQRRQGIERCKVWLNRGACPHAVESTMGLIEAQQLDERLLMPSFTQDFSLQQQDWQWCVRSTYSMALLRFVNALADSMQTGLYAQSIFMIAEKIGLPLWFVEIRHAATHEEMPSLHVLRQASVDALGWLQNQFWLPNIQQQSVRSESMQQGTSTAEYDGNILDLDDEQKKITQATAEELRQHLAAYRKLAKQIANDASLRGPSKATILSIQTRMVKCIRKADEVLIKQRKSLLQNKGSNSIDEAKLIALGQLNACDILADVLLEPGGLIPLALRKRLCSTSKGRIPAMTPILADTWMPLLKYFVEEVESFDVALIDNLIDCVTQQDQQRQQQDSTVDENTKALQEQSIVDTAASWLLYLIGSGSEGGNKSRMFDTSDGSQLSYTTIVRKCLAQPSKTFIAVAQTLCQSNPTLMERVGHLLELAESTVMLDKNSKQSQEAKGEAQSEEADEQMTDLERSILAMEKQLDALKKDDAEEIKKNSTKDEIALPSDEGEIAWQSRQNAVCALLQGWSTYNQTDWKPMPIGCLSGGGPIAEQFEFELN